MGFDENKIPELRILIIGVSYAQVHDNVNSAWVARHGFLPLISNVEKKYDGTKGRSKSVRVPMHLMSINASTIITRNLLNRRYSELAGRLGINKAAVAHIALRTLRKVQHRFCV